MVLPTLLRGDRQTRTLRSSLASDGYAAFGWELGRNLGPTPKVVAELEERLASLYAAHGPVSLVGLSMGGLFCRWLALRRPDHVRQVITVCSPFRAPLDSFFLPLRFALTLWPVPDLEKIATELDQPLSMPGTFIYSTIDGIVASESCRDLRHPESCFAIDTPHVTIANHPDVLAIVRERLGRQL